MIQGKSVQAGLRFDILAATLLGDWVVGSVRRMAGPVSVYWNWGRDSSAGSMLGSLSCMMQRRGFDPPLELPAEGICPLEVTWVLTPFPKTLLDARKNRGLVWSQTCIPSHGLKKS